MRTYIAFYKGKQIQVVSESSLTAQRLAAGLLGARKPWEVTIVLADVEFDTAGL